MAEVRVGEVEVKTFFDGSNFNDESKRSLLQLKRFRLLNRESSKLNTTPLQKLLKNVYSNLFCQHAKYLKVKSSTVEGRKVDEPESQQQELEALHKLDGKINFANWVLVVPRRRSKCVL